MDELNILPTYKEIFVEIGKQLRLRKSTLIKRTLFIIWPYIILFIIVKLFPYYYEISPNAQRINDVFYYWFFWLFLCLSVIYSLVTGFIFRIEKYIWVDSFFDKKNLKPLESWKISTGLFKSALSFQIKLWVQFYFGFIILTIVLIILTIKFSPLVFTSSNNHEFMNEVMVFLSLYVPIGILLIIYNYYLKTKLRYAYFIFLDMYGQHSSYGAMIEEMKKLNNVSKSETFKKSLLISIGADSVSGITKSAIGAINYGLSSFGNTGELFGGVISIYGNAISDQVKDFSNISAQYILYRFAHKEIYGTEQEINENVYKLINSN